MTHLTEKQKKYLSKFIIPDYLESHRMEEMRMQMYWETHAKYLTFHNFLHAEILDRVAQEMSQWKKQYLDFYTDIPDYKKGTGMLIKWATLTQLYEFFVSDELCAFFSYFYREDCRFHIETSKKIENFFRNILGITGCYFQVYNGTDFLAWHTDGPVEKISGSFVYFLNQEWKEEQWWHLQFWLRKDKEFIPYKSITPTYNTLVIFKCESDISRHRVTPVQEWMRITIHDQLHRNHV